MRNQKNNTIKSSRKSQPNKDASKLKAKSESIALHVLKDIQIIGAEVGVHRGKLSRELFKLIPGLKLFMIDIWSDKSYPDNDDTAAAPKYRDLYRNHWKENMQAARDAVMGYNAELIRADSITGAEKFADASLDFVFLDADHSYEAVKKDIATWLPKIKPGGLMSGHDYERKGKFGVQKAVDEIFGDRVIRGGNNTWFVGV